MDNKEPNVALINGQLKLNNVSGFATNVTDKIKEKYDWFINNNEPFDDDLYVAENHEDLYAEGHELVNWFKLHLKDQVIAIFDSIANKDEKVTEEDKQYLISKLSTLPKKTTVREVLRKASKIKKNRLMQITMDMPAVEINGTSVQSVYGIES
jgi:hypothetical protein